MMNDTIFTDISDLKKVVKINAALLWEAVYPFVVDAMDIYLVPYLGQELLDELLNDDVLLTRIKRAAGPFTMMLAAPELGIMIGDSGITVQNDQGKRSPANEAKIAAAIESFRFRGFKALDRLLEYLENNIDQYPSWGNSRYCTIHKDSFIRTARQYQDIGLVNIEYSILCFEQLLPTIHQLQERNIKDLLGKSLYKSLSEKIKSETLSETEIELEENIIRYLANKTAELYTSQTSREQRCGPNKPEFRPVIRPLYTDQTETGNFFADQANYYAGCITLLINENAEELGIEHSSRALNFNSKKTKLFTDIG